MASITMSVSYGAVLHSSCSSVTRFPTKTSLSNASSSHPHHSRSRLRSQAPSSSSSCCRSAVARVEAQVQESNSAAQQEEEEKPKAEVVAGGCAACGKAEKVGGCNGEGRIQGGIGAVPGFGWWPIKAFRPCPAFVEVGGRYRRVGQSLEEVAFGRKGAGDDTDISERLKG